MNCITITNTKTANKIWEIVDHKIKEFKGTYAEWMDWKERMAARNFEEEKSHLIELVERFGKTDPEEIAKRPHPFFWKAYD